MDCVFAVEMTKQLTGCTTVTTSGFEALLSIFILLPECCDRRLSFVPEACLLLPRSQSWDWSWSWN